MYEQFDESQQITVFWERMIEVANTAEVTRQRLLEKGFRLSMSRAGTPTDNGYAERFVGLFKLAVAERRPYHTLGEFLHAAQSWVQFYNATRPHESLHYRSPDQFPLEQGLPAVPPITLF